jgi:hypothetical protein
MSSKKYGHSETNRGRNPGSKEAFNCLTEYKTKPVCLEWLTVTSPDPERVYLFGQVAPATRETAKANEIHISLTVLWAMFQILRFAPTTLLPVTQPYSVDPAAYEHRYSFDANDVTRWLGFSPEDWYRAFVLFGVGFERRSGDLKKPKEQSGKSYLYYRPDDPSRIITSDNTVQHPENAAARRTIKQDLKQLNAIETLRTSGCKTRKLPADITISARESLVGRMQASKKLLQVLDRPGTDTVTKASVPLDISTLEDVLHVLSKILGQENRAGGIRNPSLAKAFVRYTPYQDELALFSAASNPDWTAHEVEQCFVIDRAINSLVPPQEDLIEACGVLGIADWRDMDMTRDKTGLKLRAHQVIGKQTLPSSSHFGFILWPWRQGEASGS